MIPSGFLTTVVRCTVVSDDQAPDWYCTIRLDIYCLPCSCLCFFFYPKLFLPSAVSCSPRLPVKAYVTLLSSLLCCYACTPCTRRTSTSLDHSIGYVSPSQERGRSSETQRVRVLFIGILTVLSHSCSITTSMRGRGGMGGKNRNA